MGRFPIRYLKNETGLKLAKGTAIGATIVLNGGLGAGEVEGNFLINGVVRKAHFVEGHAENIAAKHRSTLLIEQVK